MSLHYCDDCRARDGVEARYKKDRDEALQIADTLRSRLASVTDATTHHARLEAEMFSRLAATQKERDESRKALEAAQADRDAFIRKWNASTAEAIEATKEVRRLEALAKKHELAAGDLRFKLHEHEKLPLVRRETRIGRLGDAVAFAWARFWFRLVHEYGHVVFVLVAIAAALTASVVVFDVAQRYSVVRR